MDLNQLMTPLFTFLGVVVTAIFGFLAKKEEKREKEEEKKQKELEKMNSTMQEMAIQLKADCEGTKMLLAKDLKSTFEKAIEENFISVKDFEIAEEEFNSYTTLKGNHGIAELWEKVRKLPNSRKAVK